MPAGPPLGGDEPTTKFAAAGAPHGEDRNIESWLGELRGGTPPPAPPPPADDATRAIPVSKPESDDTETATEQLNARGKPGRAVSAQDLLRREGRL